MTQSLDTSRYCPACGAVYSDDTEFCPKDGTAVEQKARIVAGRYVLKAMIGLGNMGTVHRAVQLPMGREVAVKLLHPDLVRNPEMVARFEREAMAAAHLEHPNVVAATDLGFTDDGALFLVLEFIDGKSLRDVLGFGPLSAARVIHIARQIASALQRAHSVGIVHRDAYEKTMTCFRVSAKDAHRRRTSHGYSEAEDGSYSPLQLV